MHPDLSEHLHSAECNAIINKLKACHIDNKYARFVGVCNSFDTELQKCLKQERIDNQKANRIKAEERNQKIRQKLLENKQSN